MPSRSASITAESLRLSVAPMMDWTDTHCRNFHRLLAPHARLYTEMVHANAVIHGTATEKGRDKLLGRDDSQHPVALQLGGSEPALLAQAARIGADHGFDEINLNCGCPSDRVQAGRFGACLMREPTLVADCVAAMIDAAPATPITVKCRLGVDDDHDRVEHQLGLLAKLPVETACRVVVAFVECRGVLADLVAPHLDRINLAHAFRGHAPENTADLERFGDGFLMPGKPTEECFDHVRNG